MVEALGRREQQGEELVGKGEGGYVAQQEELARQKEELGRSAVGEQ